MSFVTAAPEFVTAAAGDLADIGSALGAANAVAALPTTGIAAAATDEVSTQIEAMFGAYAQKYQALSAQSAAFHNEFVSLLNGSALTYLSTELTNAEQTLMNTVTGAAGSGAATAATLPLLGGGSGILGGLSPVVGGGPLGPILNGFSAELGGVLSNILNGSEASLLSNPLAVLQPLLPGLYQTGMTGIITSQAGNPWAVLFANTGANLQSLVNAWAADLFPFLRQVIANQQHYAQELGSQIAVFLQDFPANVPTNIGLAIAGVSAFNPGALAQTLINQQIGYINTISTSLQKAGADLHDHNPRLRGGHGDGQPGDSDGQLPRRGAGLYTRPLRSFHHRVRHQQLVGCQDSWPGGRPAAHPWHSCPAGAELRQPVTPRLDPRTDRAELHQLRSSTQTPRRPSR